jgi:hypothetical protein
MDMDEYELKTIEISGSYPKRVISYRIVTNQKTV